MNASPQGACGVCGAALIVDLSWECRVCGGSVHAECCDGPTLVRAPVSHRLSSTCRVCRDGAHSPPVERLPPVA